MTRHLYILSCFAIFASLTPRTHTARLNAYTPLSDQTYQDLLRQQFSQSQLQQQEQPQTFQQQIQAQQYRRQQQDYKNYYSYNQQATDLGLGQNYRNLQHFQSPRQNFMPQTNQLQLQQQQLQQQYYQRPQIGSGTRPIIVDDQYIDQQYQQPQQRNSFPLNNVGLIFEPARRHNLGAEGYQGGGGAANFGGPYYERNYEFSEARQPNSIGLPSSRDSIFQLSSSTGFQPTTNSDYAAHFVSYLRKYPQRLEPRFGVQNFLGGRK